MLPTPSCVYIGDVPQLVPFLLRIFNLQDHLQFCASAGGRAAALKVTRDHHPDVILIDFESHDGWSLMLLPEIKKLAPQAACLVLTDLDTPACRRVAKSWGADALILKDDLGLTLLPTIQKALTPAP